MSISKRANDEKFELLSSPLQVDKTGYDAIDKDIVNDENNQGDNMATETPIKSSPSRFRDRLSNLFGHSRNKDISVVSNKEEQPVENCENVYEDIYKANDDQLDTKDKDANAIDNTSTENTLRSDQSENRDSTTYEEETYINTIRNQNIPSFLDGEYSRSSDVNSSLPIKEMFLDAYYDHDKERFQSLNETLPIPNGNYCLTYKWGIWKDRPSTSASTTYITYDNDQKRKLHRDFKVENKIDLTELIVDYKSRFKNLRENFQVHVFKDGVKPKKTSPILINGGIVALQIALSSSYKVWKNILRLVLDNEVQGRGLNNVELIKQGICGLSFIVKDHEYQNRKVFLMKIWLVPQDIHRPDTVDKKLILKLCNLLYNNFPPESMSSINNAKYISNHNLKVYKIFG